MTVRLAAKGIPMKSDKTTTFAFRLTPAEARAFTTVARLLGLNRQHAIAAAVVAWTRTNSVEALRSAQHNIDLLTGGEGSGGR